MIKMNKTLATLTTASALAIGGLAWAQSPGTAGSSEPLPKSSTPGAGCTATGNAMSAGNLGGNATNKNCAAGNTTAAVPAANATVAAPAPAPAAAPTAAATTPSSNDVAAAPAPSDNAPKRVARADRG